MRDSAQESPLRIAVVRPFFTQAKGGAERYAVELVTMLVACGYRVHLFAHEWDQPQLSGVTYHRVPMARKPAWLRVLTFHWRVRRVLDGTDYDVVLGMTPFAPQRTYWLGDGLYRVWTRVTWPGRARRWLMCLKRAVMLVNLGLERRIMSGGAEEYIVNSRLVRKQTIDEYGVPEQRIRLVYPGIDLTRFHGGVRAQWRAAVRASLGISEDETVFLFIANNFRRKGLDLVLRALRRTGLKRAPARLIVVGAGRWWLFKQLAFLLGVTDRVIFAGSTDEVEKYYGAADVFLLPTRYDPFAVVCLEAMACGLPVITSQMNGAAELICTGENGFVLAASQSVDSLSRAMAFLLEPARCGIAGRLAAKTAQQFSRQEHIKQITAILKEIAARRSRADRIDEIEPGLFVNRSFLPVLEVHALSSYAALAEARGARPVEYNRGKEIHLFALERDGRPLTFYLKRHVSRLSWFDWCRQAIGRTLSTEGMREWNSLLALHARAIPTITPVAAGARQLPEGLKESFVMTQGLDEHMALDQYIGQRFVTPLDKRRREEKHRLIAALARLTRQFHWSRFNHRDYYLCHLFARPVDGGVEDLRIIDLERAGYRTPLRARWIIKDLAALHYSSLALPLTNWDRLRFYTVYSRGQPRRKRRHRLRWLLRKSAAIARHDQKLRRLKSEETPFHSLRRPQVGKD